MLCSTTGIFRLLPRSTQTIVFVSGALAGAWVSVAVFSRRRLTDRILGGSSAMNFCAWTKPHAKDVDAWEKLGNSGWNWEMYHKYSQHSER